MSAELIKYAFIAGELSPSLFGRTDLTKYDLGMALMKNWYVDYRGGMTTRPGTEFLDYIKADDKPVKLIEFQFSPNLTDTYVVLFGDEYIRFIQDGAYVLTGEQSLTSIATTGGVVTVTKASHGLTDGTWIKLNEVVGLSDLNGATFVVGSATTNTFQLVSPRTGLAISRAGETWTSGGKIYEIYEIASPYAAEDLEKLSDFQIRNLVRLTHTDYAVRNLIRNDHDDWEIVEENFEARVFSETAWGITGTPSASGDMSVIYAVSAVLEDGSESVPSYPHRIGGAADYTTGSGRSIRIGWKTIPGAKEYIIYRSVVGFIPNNAAYGSQLGYIGRTKSTSFVDAYILADFTKGPYEGYDPFALGKIESITISNPGTGYNPISVISISGGNNLSGYAIANDDGELTNIIILSAGDGFSGTPSYSIGSGGTGAVLDITVGATTGVYPSIASLFQQRQIYAASITQPLTLWASQIKRYNNFDSSIYTIDSDSYEFEIDAAQVAPLLHLFSLRGGMVMLSQTGLWLLTGGASGVVTPSNALADPQSYTGVSPVRPLQIGSDLLYVEGKGFSVRLLAYNDFSKVYSGEDKSILSGHLFSYDKQIISWAFAENPLKLVFGIRSDGILLMFTTVKEQDVYAWTWGQTRGYFRNILSIPENGRDSIYVVVERTIEDVTHKYLERFKLSEWQNIEDAYAVDCGFQLLPPPVADNALTITDRVITTDGYFVTLISDTDFTDKEDWWVRASGGIYVIREIDGDGNALAKEIIPATELRPEDPEERIKTAEAGAWTLAEPQKEFSGLDHIEGELVSILGDGSVFPSQTVVGGKITLPDGVSKVAVGLGYTAIAQTLPPTVQDVPIEARRKRIIGVAVRLHRARGLEVGNTLDKLYPMRERTNESYGTATIPINGFKHQLVEADWDDEGQTYFVQKYPLPSSVLALVPDLEVGDDTN